MPGSDINKSGFGAKSALKAKSTVSEKSFIVLI
jgi:hypothetical protein